MFRTPANLLCAAAIAIPALLASSVALPASAQVSVNVSIGYNNFHDRLAPYGTWINDPRWGRVWHPSRVSSNFRPYYDGHWVNTREYGWMWVSNERFGDITYHYGRWVLDRRNGWLWVPGYVWAPSWVVWRSGGGNIAWFPMPPGDDYYGQGAYRGSFQDRYGYDSWYGSGFDNNLFLSLWIVVGQDHFADTNYRNYLAPQRNYTSFASQTRDYTNYSTVNNYVVNRSIDSALPQRNASPSFQPVPAARVIGANAPTPVTVGRQVEQRERQQQPAQQQPGIAQQQAPAPQVERGGNRGQGNNAPAAAPQAAPAPAAPQAERGGNRGQGNNRPEPAPQAAAPLQQAPAAAPQAERGGNRGQGNNRPEPAPQAAAPQPAAPAAAPPAEERGNRGQGNNRPEPPPQAAAPQAAAPAATPPAERGGNRGRGNDQPAAEPKPAPADTPARGNRGRDNDPPGQQ